MSMFTQSPNSWLKKQQMLQEKEEEQKQMQHEDMEKAMEFKNGVIRTLFHENQKIHDALKAEKANREKLLGWGRILRQQKEDVRKSNQNDLDWHKARVAELEKELKEVYDLRTQMKHLRTENRRLRSIISWRLPDLDKAKDWN